MENKTFRVWDDSSFFYFDDIKTAELKAKNNPKRISELVGKDKNDETIYVHDIVKIGEAKLVVHGLDGEEIILLEYRDEIPNRIFIKDYKNQIIKVGNLFENSDIIKSSSF